MEKDYIVKVLEEILLIDSPSGFCAKAADRLIEVAMAMGYNPRKTNKGCVEIEVQGESHGKKDSKRIGVTAHLDTLGAVVRSVSSNGDINFTTIGGLNLATADSEYCRIHTRDGKIFTGTFLANHPSVHVYRDAKTMPRDAANMYIRLDEKVKNAADVKNLGIEVGDVIALDTKFVYTSSGFIKSRFLDDKASVALILCALKAFADKKQKPKHDLKIIFTVYEEVGHGGAPFGEDLDEVLAVDMGCIGADLKCTEYDVSICAGDSMGLYNYDMTTRLIELAKKHKLSYAVDLYPFYSSDVGSMLRAGRDIRGALIGSGIHASHGMERTHIDGLINTYELLMAYLTE